MELRPYRRKAYYYETDRMDIVHHSNYVRWLEEARVDLMEQLGYDHEDLIDMLLEQAVENSDRNY